MPDALTGHDAAWGLLDAVAGVNAYDGEVPKTPPLDDDGRVAAYAVLYYSPGRQYASAMDGQQVSRDSVFQVTCVGGDPTRAIWCTDAVSAALVGAVVTIEGVTRQIRASEDDPGPVRRDDNVTPPRHYVPLRFRLHTP